MKTVNLRAPYGKFLWFSILLIVFASCTVSMKDVQGIYLGVMTDLNDKSAEYFLQLYQNGQYTLRKTPYEDGVRNLFRTGTWFVDGLTVVLVADGEKDVRFVWERGTLRLEAAASALQALPFDHVSLKRLVQ